MAITFLVLNVMDVFITVPNEQENVTITDKSIWNQEDGEFTAFGVQIGGRTQNKKLRRFVRL